MKVRRKLLLGGVTAAVVALLAVPVAGAHRPGPATEHGLGPATFFQAVRGGADVFTARLDPVPHPGDDGGSNVTGRAVLIRSGSAVRVIIVARGLAPGLPHAQHIHGIGLDRCPGPGADANGDGLISTAEGVPDYGAVQVSLTTSGDTSPASALAVDRFPVAGLLGVHRLGGDLARQIGGIIVYDRTLRIGTDIPAAVADDLVHHHIVLHGIDVNGNGAYDFGAGVSSLDPSLPLEATVPAACGEIEQLF